MTSDLRSAFRQLAKSPGYSLVVVLTLALGIAVNTNIFAMVQLFFLQRLPVPQAEQLVLVLQTSETWDKPHGPSFPDFQDYRARMKSVTDFVAFQPMPAHLGASGKAPQRTWVEVVTPNAFAAMRVPAALGRTLLPSDGEKKGGAPVAMLSWEAWQQRFGGAADIVDHTIQLNGRPFTVIGVAPRGFHSFSASLAPSVFVPVGALDSFKDGGANQLEWRGSAGWRTLARLAPGHDLASVRAEAALVLAQLAREHPDSHHGAKSVVMAENRARPDPTFAPFMPVFAALFTGLVVLVLFIACANVANLMLARAATRQRELTVRASLGASRGRLVRQLLVESLVLAAIAGVVGWLLSVWTGTLLQRFAPQGDMPVVMDTGSPWLTNLFTVTISLVAGLASGVIPAWRASRVNLVEDLKEGAGGRLVATRHWIRNSLVVGQVTFSLVVLICAGLFLRTLRVMERIDLGFRPDHLLLASYDLGLQGYPAERQAVFERQLLERVRALPGVSGAALSSALPFDYQVPMRSVFPDNPPETMRDGTTTAGIYQVSPGFIEMLGLRMRRGRALAESDRADTKLVAVVNARFAELCWPGQEPLGRAFRPWKDGPLIEVVGLAETAKYVMLAEDPRPVFYVPLAQSPSAPVSVLLRTQGDPAALAGTLRDTFRSLDPHLPTYNVRTMEELMANSAFAFMPFRMGVTLAGTQGAIGLLLAVMGLYAVVAFGVAQRTREIGIRLALGAQPSAIVRAVLREGVRLTAIGLGAGLAIAALFTLALSHAMHGVIGFEPLTFVVFTALLVGVAALACWWPARRATRIDPVTALRTE